MSIYRQHAVLKRHKSNVAFLEAKMLLLCIFLLSCCLSASMGSAIKEFQANFKALVELEKKETFLPVPIGKFQCNHVPCQLERTIEKLKDNCKDDQMRTRISLMEKNKDHIVSSLNKACTKPKTDSSCLTTEMDLQNALRQYERFFQKLEEKC